jgi:hypothetical protein
MARYSSYDIEKIDRLPLRSFYALLHQCGRARKRDIRDRAHAARLAKASQKDFQHSLAELDT